MMDYYFYSIIFICIGVFFDTVNSLYNYEKYYSDNGIFNINLMYKRKGKDFYSKMLSFFKPIINNQTFYYLLILRLILCVVLIICVKKTYFLIFILFVVQLFFNLRNRLGLSGADQMRTIILFGLSVMSVKSNNLFAVGLIFIIIQLYISYFFTGYNKIKSPIWRKGNALIWVLNNSLFGNSKIQKQLIEKGKIFNIILCWIVILFQLLFPFFGSLNYTVIYVLILGVFFHLLLAIISNLNDFFWTYVSTYPLVYFFSIKFVFCDYFDCL